MKKFNHSLTITKIQLFLFLVVCLILNDISFAQDSADINVVPEQLIAQPETTVQSVQDTTVVAPPIIEAVPDTQQDVTTEDTPSVFSEEALQPPLAPEPINLETTSAAPLAPPEVPSNLIAPEAFTRDAITPTIISVDSTTTVTNFIPFGAAARQGDCSIYNNTEKITARTGTPFELCCLQFPENKGCETTRL